MNDKSFENFSFAIRSFSEITDNDLSEILSYCSTVYLKKNDFLLREGQICQKVYYINSGIIRHYYKTSDDEVTRWISTDNNFTTSLRSFINKMPGIESLQAITNCEVVVFDRKTFEVLIEKNEGFKNLWIKVLEYNYITIENRVFSLIEKSAEQRFLWMAKNWPRFIQQIPVMYIASMLGITPRHLSRLRKAHNL